MKKIIKLYKKSMGSLLLLLLVTAGLAGCSTDEQEQQPGAVSYIDQEEAKRIMEEETGYLILDVRTQEEFSQGHIKDAICIPNETIDESVSEILKDKDQQLLIYCRSGNRSRQAAGKLEKLGYTDIKEFGGINTWPYEIVK